MSIDKAKALKAAQKYLAKDQLDRAIAEFERIVAEDPADSRSLLKLGDIYTRQGDHRRAASTYRKVAGQYAAQGFFLKAMAVYKQILKLDPADLVALESLADMYEKLSLTNDAVSAYEAVVDAHAQAGSSEKAVNALGRLAALDQNNVATWVRYAELLSKADRIDEATAAFRHAADVLRSQERIDDYIKVTERLLFHSHEDVSLARDLASVYIERGQPKSALPHLQLCFKANARDTATLNLLARAFIGLSQREKAASVYRELIRIHVENGETEEEQWAEEKLRELESGAADAGAATAENEPVEVVEMDDLEMVEDDVGGMVAAGHEDADVAATVAQLMDEAEGFLRYKLRDRLVAQLKRVLALDPNHVVARERLRDTLIERGDTGGAVEQLLLLSDIVAHSDLRQTIRYLEQAAKLAPGNETVAARLRVSRVALTESSDRKATRQLPVATVPEPLAAAPEFAERDETDFSDLSSNPPPKPRGASPAPARQPPRVAAPVAEIEEELEEEALEPMTVEVPIPARDGSAATRAPIEPRAESFDAEPFEDATHNAGPRDAAVFDAEPRDAEALQTEPFNPEPHAFEPPAAEAEPVESGADALSEEELPEAVADALEEAGFYRSQRLFDEAREVLVEARASNGDHPALLAKLRELDELQGVASEQEPAPHPLQEEQHDASEGMAAAPIPDIGVHSTPGSVADVVEQFRNGVASQLGGSDMGAHYDLGLAYMEMSLHGEAIEEFTHCLMSEELQRRALTKIGVCEVARGQPGEGILAFERVLQLPGLTPEEELDLWFEIGCAQEALGQVADATLWFSKVQERDPSYRDVEGRLVQLTSDAPAPASELDEVDAMFDNLILKD